MNPNTSKSILVTGGNGFLGGVIVQELRKSDLFPACTIRVLDVHEQSDHEDVEYIQGDVRNEDQVKKATSNVDVVFHAAAIVDWGTRSEAEVMSVNFDGTVNIINACRDHGIRALVYTSTLDVIYNGKPLVNIRENQPYPEKQQNAYCRSKMLAEQRVVEANTDIFKTGVIRPADVWGEGDPYHIGSLVNMAETGFYVRLGNGGSCCQHVYVGNVASAHIQLANALLSGNSDVEGEVYFITDPGSHNFFSFFDRIIQEAGYRIRPKNLWIPYGLAYAMASVSEAAAWAWRPVKHYNPKFSRFAVDYTCTDFTFTSEKAIRDFDYQLRYPLEEAIGRTVSFYRQYRLRGKNKE